MYPAYPLLALNAALALHNVLAYFGNPDRKALVGRIPATVKLAVVCSFILMTISAGALRITGLVTAYRAPLTIYEPLGTPEHADMEATVCLGKEWYRFPSSYFLPSNMRAKFIKSEFDGLLPAQYNEAAIGFGLFPGTWLIPPGMNDENREDPGKYVRLIQSYGLLVANHPQIDVDHCNFLIDSQFPDSQTSALEPDYISDHRTWEELQCSSFLDASRTSIIGRILWVPNWAIVPPRFRRKWGRHCLLKRRIAP